SSRSASPRSPARSSAPRAAGSSGATPPSATSTKPLRAATSPPGKSRSSFQKKSARRSGHCANDSPHPGSWVRVDLLLRAGQDASYLAAEPDVARVSGPPRSGIGRQLGEGGPQRRHGLVGLGGCPPPAPPPPTHTAP